MLFVSRTLRLRKQTAQTGVSWQPEGHTRCIGWLSEADRLKQPTGCFKIGPKNKRIRPKMVGFVKIDKKSKKTERCVTQLAFFLENVLFSEFSMCKRHFSDAAAFSVFLRHMIFIICCLFSSFSHLHLLSLSSPSSLLFSSLLFSSLLFSSLLFSSLLFSSLLFSSLLFSSPHRGLPLSLLLSFPLCLVL